MCSRVDRTMLTTANGYELSASVQQLCSESCSLLEDHISVARFSSRQVITPKIGH